MLIQHSRRRARRGALIVAIVGLLAAAGGVATVLYLAPRAASAGSLEPGRATPTHTPSISPPVPAQPEPEPAPAQLSPAQQLLADAGDPSQCAMTFTGSVDPLSPILVSRDHRLTSVPIPTAAGQAFAGWYPSAEAAAEMDPAQRINDADVATCDANSELNVFAAWVPAEVADASSVEVPILMYHQFTQLPEGEDNAMKANYLYVLAFAEHLQYLKDQGYYLPSWPELYAFVQGTLVLPEKSVIITDDDADPTWLEWAVPLVQEKQMMTTSFVITSARQDATPSEWVLQRTHTHDMHSAGANGEGRMVNYSVEEMVADLTTSTQILGAAEVLAYPFGHYNDQSKQAVAEAGLLMAVTTENGRVRVGSDPLALPRVRVSFGTDVTALVNALGD